MAGMWRPTLSWYETETKTLMTPLDLFECWNVSSKILPADSTSLICHALRSTKSVMIEFIKSKACKEFLKHFLHVKTKGNWIYYWNFPVLVK